MARKNYEELSYEEIISEIMKKKEFSDLPKKDVELVYSQFEEEEFVEDKIKKAREMLMKMYTVFVSGKLLNIKDKTPGWFLKKHKSTSERLNYYEDVYKKCLDKVNKKIIIYDLGCGINGFSYDYFEKIGYSASYFGFEAVGQLVNLQNNWFRKEKKNAICVQGSLFNLESVKNFLKKGKGEKIIFLFKTLDSLEMLKRDYSKKLLKEIIPLVDRCVVSWATASLISKKKFFANKKWLREFIEKEFSIVDEFEIGGENYLVFEEK